MSEVENEILVGGARYGLVNGCWAYYDDKFGNVWRDVEMPITCELLSALIEARAERDAERLDWLEAQSAMSAASNPNGEVLLFSLPVSLDAPPAHIEHHGEGWLAAMGPTLRDAIDAARTIQNDVQNLP